MESWVIISIKVGYYDKYQMTNPYVTNIENIDYVKKIFQNIHL